MPDKDPEKNRERARKYRKEHPEKARAAVRKWLAENPERVKEHKRQAYAANRETEKAKHQKWYEANREKVIEKSKEWIDKNRDKHTAYVKKWQAANPENRRIVSARRRSRKAETLVTLTTTQTAEILQSGCFFCGTHENLTIAHDIPVAKKGNTTRANCFCLCQSCNSKMQTKTLAQKIKQLLFPF